MSFCSSQIRFDSEHYLFFLYGNFLLNLDWAADELRVPRRAVWGEGWTAAVSLWSSVGKSTYCTSLGKVTDMAVCPSHLSLKLHTSTQTKESQAAETVTRPQSAIVLQACG